MMFANLLLGVALVVASPTNAPTAFSTEVEHTFQIPDITERKVWLDSGIDFFPTSSNRIEIAFGPDVDGDGLLGDDEVPLVFSIDCGRMIVRDGSKMNSSARFQRTSCNLNGPLPKSHSSGCCRSLCLRISFGVISS